MKLLMITGLGSARDLASGKRGAFYNTLEEFHKYWERIDIICPRFDLFKDSRSNLDVKILFENVFIHISPWPVFFYPFWFIKKALEIYREQKFNLMTVHEFPPFYNGIAARILWHKTKVPYILEIHHIPGYPKAANFKETTYRWAMRFFIKSDSSKAKVVRVVNQKQTPEFLKKAGVPQDKIFYIPSMYIDLETFKPTNSQKNYDLIFVGRMESNKGVDLFLNVVKKIKCRAVMVGDGSLLEETRQKIKDLELNIATVGRVRSSKDVAEWINRSKILVMPSYNEGGPRVVLEAMACGVPVLATNVGLVPDFADKNAVKVVDWNAEDIAEKSEELLEDENERTRLIQAGLEIAKKFEKKAMIKNYAEQLKELLG